MTTTISRIIEQQHDDIIERWERQANKASAAKGLTHIELKNLLPVYLSSLVQRISLPTHQQSEDQKQLVANHLSTRLRQGFVLLIRSGGHSIYAAAAI